MLHSPCHQIDQCLRVSITNLGTNQAVTLTTSEADAYAATSLDPATYSITVEAPNFKKAVVESVKVVTATTVNHNLTLEAGAIGETITVKSEAAALNSESGVTSQGSI